MTIEEQAISERLRQALAEKATAVTPSPDGLDQIQERAGALVSPTATVTQLRSSRPIVRYVALAAASLAIVGTLGYFLQQRSTTKLDLAIPPSTLSPTTTAPIPTTEPTEPTPETSVDDAPAIVLPAPPTGPPAATKTEAGQKFLDLVGIASPFTMSETDAGVTVHRPEGTAVVQLDMTAVDGGWAVTKAHSFGVTAYTEPTPDPGVSSLAIAGDGRGFEGTLNLRLISALDGSHLAGDYTNAGMPDPVPYATELKVMGSEAAWVIVSGDGGGENVLQEFAAVPVVYNAEPDARDFGVFRIATSDSDKGLNIRTSPGIVDNSVVTTLPPGTSGIRRTSTLPVLVEDSIWWEVTTAEGATGWAHSSFLTNIDADVDDEELLAIGANFLEAARQETHWMFPFQPWSTRVPIAYGWTGVLDNKAYRFEGAQFVDAGVWGPDAFRDWAVPEATFGQPAVNTTYWDFLGLRDAVNPQVRVGDGNYPYEFETSMISSYVPNVRSVVISDANPPGIWRAVHLFVEPTPAGPQIVAIAVSIMVP